MVRTAGILATLCLVVALHAPVSAQEPTPGDPGPSGTMEVELPEILGALDRSLILRIIEHNREELRGCYTAALDDHPDLAGEVTLRFKISSIGLVSDVSVEESDLGESTVVDCLVEAMPDVRFPAGKGAGIVWVKMRLRFAPV